MDIAFTPEVSTPLTVLMSVYNGAPFLNEAIESIRGQTFDRFEFLIIDDGSTDGSAGILARHAAADSRIRVIHQENCGLTAALNRGIDEARTEFVARMDQDDIARPYRLEAQMAFLAAYPSIALVGGAIEVIDAEGRPKQTIRLPEEPDQIRRHMRELGCAVAHPTVVFRRNAVLESGGFRTAYRHADDYDLWLRMLEKYDFANLPEVLLSYRRHGGATSIKHATQQVLFSLCARAAARRRLAGQPDPTWNVDLITPEIVLSLGVDEHTLNQEMVRGIREAAEMAIDQGRPAAAAEFLGAALPYAERGHLEKLALTLNRRAVRAEATPEQRAEHQRLLLEAAPEMFRDVFGSAVSDASFGPPALVQEPLFDILKTKKYNTDKSEAYLHDYHRTFGHLRDKQIALMEIGVNRGGSLYLWRDYFPHGSILGIDLNPPLDFKDETGRCRLLRCDQGDTDTLRRLAASTSPQGFDIIIDDASHLASLTAATFKALFYDHLRPGGYYAIEDWGTGYWEMWPDGVQPLPPLEPNFPNVGKRFPSHEAGMAGFVKQLVDECALADICHPRFGIPRTRRNSIRGMHISTGLVIVEKASE